VFVVVKIIRRGNHAQRRARSRATSASHIDGDRFTYAFIRFTASSSSVSRAFAFARASRSPNLLQAIESSFECFQSSPSRLILRRAAHPTPSNHEVTHHVPFASNRVARVGRNAPSATRVRAEKVAAVALRIEKRSRASSSVLARVTNRHESVVKIFIHRSFVLAFVARASSRRARRVPRPRGMSPPGSGGRRHRVTRRVSDLRPASWRGAFARKNIFSCVYAYLIVVVANIVVCVVDEWRRDGAPFAKTLT
jgi:hypothetical protein